jgi:hypothetical protein
MFKSGEEGNVSNGVGYKVQHKHYLEKQIILGIINQRNQATSDIIKILINNETDKKNIIRDTTTKLQDIITEINTTNLAIDSAHQNHITKIRNIETEISTELNTIERKIEKNASHTTKEVQHLDTLKKQIKDDIGNYELEIRELKDRKYKLLRENQKVRNRNINELVSYIKQQKANKQRIVTNYTELNNIGKKIKEKYLEHEVVVHKKRLVYKTYHSLKNDIVKIEESIAENNKHIQLIVSNPQPIGIGIGCMIPGVSNSIIGGIETKPTLSVLDYLNSNGLLNKQIEEIHAKPEMNVVDYVKALDEENRIILNQIATLKHNNTQLKAVITQTSERNIQKKKKEELDVSQHTINRKILDIKKIITDLNVKLSVLDAQHSANMDFITKSGDLNNTFLENLGGKKIILLDTETTLFNDSLGVLDSKKCELITESGLLREHIKKTRNEVNDITIKIDQLKSESESFNQVMNQKIIRLNKKIIKTKKIILNNRRHVIAETSI